MLRVAHIWVFPTKFAQWNSIACTMMWRHGMYMYNTFFVGFLIQDLTPRLPPACQFQTSPQQCWRLSPPSPLPTPLILAPPPSPWRQPRVPLEWQCPTRVLITATRDKLESQVRPRHLWAAQIACLSALSLPLPSPPLPNHTHFLGLALVRVLWQLLAMAKGVLVRLTLQRLLQLQLYQQVVLWAGQLVVVVVRWVEVIMWHQLRRRQLLAEPWLQLPWFLVRRPIPLLPKVCVCMWRMHVCIVHVHVCVTLYLSLYIS